MLLTIYDFIIYTICNYDVSFILKKFLKLKILLTISLL